MCFVACANDDWTSFFRRLIGGVALLPTGSGGVTSRVRRADDVERCVRIVDTHRHAPPLARPFATIDSRGAPMARPTKQTKSVIVLANRSRCATSIARAARAAAAHTHRIDPSSPPPCSASIAAHRRRRSARAEGFPQRHRRCRARSSRWISIAKFRANSAKAPSEGR